MATAEPSAAASQVDRRDENWGMPGFLSREQEEALTQLRTRLREDPDPTLDNLRDWHDRHLLRFLRDRGFNVDKAFKMLKGHAEWRIEVTPKDGVTKEAFPRFIQDHLKGAIYLAGRDRKGRPLLVLRGCQLFPARYKIPEVFAFVRFYTDELNKLADETDTCEISAIGDLKDWSLSNNFSLKFALALLNLQTNHFPETAGRVYLVNLPMSFNYALSMMRPFIDPRDRVVQIWSPNDMHLIQEGVDPAVLEKVYGGQHDPYPLPDPIVGKLLVEEEEEEGAEEKPESEAMRLLREEEEAKTRRDQLLKTFLAYIFGAGILFGATIAIFHDFNPYITATEFLLENIVALEISSVIFQGEVFGLQFIQSIPLIPLAVILVGSCIEHASTLGWLKEVSVLKLLEELYVLDPRSCLLLASASIAFIAVHHLLVSQRNKTEAIRAAEKAEAQKRKQEERKKRSKKKPKIVDVAVADHRVRTETHGRPEYKILVTTDSENEKYEIWKRYSEFRKLHDEIKVAGISPAKKLPPKSPSLFRSDLEDEFLKERRENLNEYLRDLVSGKNDHDPSVLEFLAR